MTKLYIEDKLAIFPSEQTENSLEHQARDRDDIVGVSSRVLIVTFGC